jgi:uncharacterized protein (DUF1501 family)
MSMSISRRLFLKKTGCAAIALGFTPFFVERAIAETIGGGTKRRKVFVLIIQRGAMDGLSMLPPIGEPEYYALRSSIALQRTGDMPVIPIDSHFGMNPEMKALRPLWDEGTLAFIPQSGSPNPSRSHFDAQDFFETGTPGEKNTADGFLNRALLEMGSSQAQGRSPLRAVAMQPSMPRVLQGSYPAISMESLKDFDLKDLNKSGAQKEYQNFSDMYQQAVDHVFRGVGTEVFESLKTVSLVREAGGAHDHDPGKDSLYPKAQIGKRLSEIATLIKADVGLEIAVTDMGGWDTHINQGNGKGQLADRLRELSEAIAAFRKDLGAKFEDVCIATVTEFGRTVKENGTRGTDHGHGSVMMVAGGAVRGKRILGNWRSLKHENLFEGRDLPVTTDSRDVLSEILHRHCGVQDLAKVFPAFSFNPGRFPGVLRG